MTSRGQKNGVAKIRIPILVLSALVCSAILAPTPDFLTLLVQGLGGIGVALFIVLVIRITVGELQGTQRQLNFTSIGIGAGAALISNAVLSNLPAFGG